MPLAFTDEDFADTQPSEKIEFSDADFAPKLDLSKAVELNPYEREQMRLSGTGRLPYNPLSGGYTGTPGTAPEEDVSLTRAVAPLGMELLHAPGAAVKFAEDKLIRAPLEYLYKHAPVVTEEKLDTSRYDPRVEAQKEFGPPTAPDFNATRQVTPESVGITPDTPMIPPPPESEHGFLAGLERAGSAMTTPVSATTLPFFEFKPVRAAYALSTAAQIPESLARMFDAPTEAERREAAANVGLESLMTGLLGRSLKTKGVPNASRVKEAAEVYGDVRPQPGEGAGTLPAQEGSPGVQPQTPAAKEGQVLLSPEEQSYIDAEREGIGAGIEVGAEHADPDQPFAANETASINRKTGKIVINPEQFRQQLSELPPERRQPYVKSLLAEEENHLATSPEDADAYVGAMSGVEKALETRAYTGKWTRAGAEAAHGIKISDRTLGYEASRRRMQQLARMSPTEVAQAVGAEKWKMEGINVLQRMISRTMETLPTERGGLRRAILERIQGNLDAARFVVAGGNPASLSRPREKSDQYLKMAPRAFASQFGTGKAGLTSMSYRFAEQFGPDELGTLEAAHDQALKQLRAAKGGDIQKYMDEGMRKQFFNEALKWRKALNEAALSGASTLEDFAKLEKDFGVGESMRGGQDLKRAFEAEEVPQQQATALAPESGRQLTATESLVQRLEGPSSLRRPKAPKEHPELFLTPLGKGAEREPTPERYREPITPALVQQEIAAHLSESTRPNFQEFSDSVRRRHGNVQPEQLREAWRDAVWNKLMSDPGTELSRLRSGLGLGRELGLEREIADRPVEEPRVKTPKQMELGSGNIVDPIRQEALTADEAAAKQRQQSRQNYRANVISTIGQKLINESETGRKAWNRKDVSPEEIGFWRQSAEPAWNTITSEDLSSPEALGRMLTTDARQEASTKIVKPGTEAHPQPTVSKRKAPPVSVTKRLTALLDKRTGKVQLVSTYRDGRRGAVLYDVNAPGRTHTPLAQMLDRYRPLHSILLDEPVQNFHKTFDSVRDFEEQFGSEARNRSAEYAARESELGPEAGVLERTGEEPPAIPFGAPLTDAEAGSILDHVIDEVDKIESPDDMRLGLEGLRASAESGRLTGRDRQVVSALQKAVRETQRRYPDLLTEDQAIEQTLDELYDIAKRAENREDFVQQTLGRFARSPEEAVRPAAGGETAVSPTARELSTLRDVAPTVDPNVVLPKGPGPEPTLPEPTAPEMLSPEARAAVEQRAEENNPKSLRRAKEKSQDEFTSIKDEIKAWGARRQTKADIVRLRDGADTTANNFSRQSGNSVRVESANPEVRAAAKAVIAAAGDKGRIDNFFIPMVETGRVKAENMLARGTPQSLLIGRQWLNAVNKLRAELDYAKAHWNDPDLQATSDAAKREMKEAFDFETKNGINLKNTENYVPGRYDAELWNDHEVMFGDQRILGRNFRKPKAFENYYSAIQNGPYIPKSYDLADLVEHRVRQGRKQVNKQLWLDNLKNMKDPDSGLPVVQKPKIKDGRAVPANNESELFSLGAGHDPVSVRVGYKSLLEAMTMQGQLSKSPAFKAALAVNGLLKHGVILILDTFHPGRLGQYAASLLGKEAGFRGGWSALDYREADLPKAIANGWVSPEAAAWASEPVEVSMPNGRKIQYTRRQILNEMQKQGLNVGKIQDAIYSDMVRNWPVIGTLNRWTFDVMTRGLMSESAVRSFEKLNKKYPNVDARKMMKDVVKDVNMYYGSIGRQGWIRNPTIREISQLALLAPQWVEGLVQKEVRFAARTAMAPISAYRGTPMLGALGSGMGKGLAAYFLLTQVLNMITKGHTTFKNKEEGHKLDAWIPTGEDSGFWLSPLSVFGEITHDLLRMGESKPTAYEAIRQIGANKLSPFGRLAWIFATRENAQGQRITSTRGMIGEMAKQLAPAPISLGTPVRAAVHAIAPGLMSPPPPGALQQRLLGSAGIKVQPGESALQQAQHTANRFMEENHLKPETGFVLTPTDEPSYSKLRSAIRNGDPKGMKSVMEELRKTKTDEQILKAMQLWAKRPMTGSNKGEALLLTQMDDDQFATYEKAMEQRQKLWNDFLDFYMKN